MMSQVTSKGRLSAIDLIFSVMDSHQRPMEFTLLLHLKDTPRLDAVRRGARSARNLYSATGSYIDKDHWARFIEPGDGVAAVSVSSSEDLAKAIQEFLNSPFDLRLHMPVQQLVVVNGTSAELKLVTRFHHAVADGLSAAMWLSHQLRVARGKEAAVAKVRGFTYNDLLATCALEVFAQWNRGHCNGRRQKIGLWLPVNIRQKSSAGFGNGTSRIRLYARYSDRASLADKCREIRRQVFWSNRHGEWAVPQEPPLTYLPQWAITPLVRCYLNRPWVDMATGVFSHAERWPGDSAEIFQDLEKIESIGQLHARYCVAINGATHGGRTWLTFTYDPALLSPGDIQCLVEMYQEQLSLARREF